MPSSNASARCCLLTIVDRISPAGRAAFTVREKEGPELLIAGRSNKEIGSSLGIGERTVKAHVAKLMRKVGVENRIALSVYALKTLASYRKIEVEVSGPRKRQAAERGIGCRH